MKSKLFALALISPIILINLMFATQAFAMVNTPANPNGASSNPTLAQAGSGCASTSTFFGLLPWYAYLQSYKTQDKTLHHDICNICFDVLGNQTQAVFNTTTNQMQTVCNKSSASDITLVLLAVVDDLLRISGLIAIGMVLYSSVMFITSQGQPESVAKARSGIINALIGAAIALFAIVIVTFLGKKLGG